MIRWDLGCTSWKNADIFLAASLEVYIPWGSCKDREVSAKTDILPQSEFRAALANDNRSTIDKFAPKALDAQPFARTIVNV